MGVQIGSSKLPSFWNPIYWGAWSGPSKSPQFQDRGTCFSRTHPSRDAIFCWPKMPREMPEIITSHDVFEPLKQLRLIKRYRLRFSCVCVLKTQRFEPLRFRGTERRRPMRFWGSARQSVSSCYLRFRTAIWRYRWGQGCDVGNCIAKTLRFCVCVWKTTRKQVLGASRDVNDSSQIKFAVWSWRGVSH